ncbi:hypothetical protein EDC04DRAFT_448608 [Pisolithus marmoratus]|nr:hypothetical protein EDC04DRAFT_448608 [Pisolithus marmoratus]
MLPLSVLALLSVPTFQVIRGFHIYYTPPPPQHSFPYAFTFSPPSPSKLCFPSRRVDRFHHTSTPEGSGHLFAVRVGSSVPCLYCAGSLPSCTCYGIPPE